MPDTLKVQLIDDDIRLDMQPKNVDILNQVTWNATASSQSNGIVVNLLQDGTSIDTGDFNVSLNIQIIEGRPRIIICNDQSGNPVCEIKVDEHGVKIERDSRIKMSVENNIQDNVQILSLDAPILDIKEYESWKTETRRLLIAEKSAANMTDEVLSVNKKPKL